MASFLQKVRSLFSKAEKQAPSQAKKVKPKRVRVNTASDKEVQSLGQLKLAVEKNGYCSMKVKSLFQLFGYKQRGSANVPKVLERLQKEGLFASRRVVLDTDWNRNVRVYSFPVEQFGHQFRSEREMEDAFTDNSWYTKLGLEINTESEGNRVSDRQFKPRGTKDRLDFRAMDGEGNHVAVELKNRGGDNRLVEQALRYRTHLMKHFATERVRCVIITGERCLHTAKALYGLRPEEKSLITWYVYDWDKDKPKEISFEPVSMDFISKHLKKDSTEVEV